MNIRKLLIATAILGVGMTSTRAADIPAASPRAPAMVAVPAAFNWTGFYLGVMGGYAFGSGDVSDLKGGFAGGTVGFNYQPVGSPLVVGIEGDAAWTNFGYSITATGGGGTATAETKADFMATFRARIGAAFDRALIYVTGGGALVNNTITLSVAVPGFTTGASSTKNHTGYAAGGGFEYAFTPNLSGKVEYLYLGLGSETYFSTGGVGGVASGDVNIHTVKAGLNFRF